MANPALVTCTKDTWVKVATNVTAGFIQKRSNAPTGYLQTYRATGQAAPENLDDAVKAFVWKEYEEIKAGAAIDVYIYAQGEAGQIRADL